ncbi:MAG TPA: zinc ribbon domain-containing protein [Chloroflexota bacterium]|nr:zinc ribbon domain-containing protein [Chloroflexota bacterium]
MPVYEYYCAACRTRFEQLVRTAGAGEQAPCPECGQDAPRVFSTFATMRRGGDGAELASTARSCACTPATCGCR